MPTLRPAQALVLDNLSAHKSERVRELIEGRDRELLFLPPYSPDLNPIEEAFSKVKAFLRRAEARRTRPAAAGHSWTPSVVCSRRSPPETRGASSSIEATTRQSNRCERCCKR